MLIKSLECILKQKFKVSFDDIAGNEYAKEIIQETFIFPARNPKFFQHIGARPWQSILLYGVTRISF